MRLAFVAPFPPNPNGEGNYTQQFVQALLRNGNSPTIAVFAHRHPNSPAFERVSENLTVYRTTDPAKPWRRHLGCITLARAVLRWRPDIVHIEGGLVPYYGGPFGEPLILLLAVLRAFGCKVVVTAHSTWTPVHVRNLVLGAGHGPALARILVWYYALLLRLMCKVSHCAAICTAGNGCPVVQDFIAANRLPPHKCVIEPHPCAQPSQLPVPRLEAKQKLGLAGRTLVLSAGFIRPDKAYDILLRSAPELQRKHQELVIVIAGRPGRDKDRQYAEQLHALRAALPDPGRVQLVFRHLDDAEFANYMDAADVVVIPYARSIGPSGPVHHSLGRGTAVIASDLGHNQPLSGVCCLVRPNDPDSLRDAIDELLTSPAKLAAQQHAALEYARAHNWDNMAKAYILLYRQLAKTGRIDKAAALQMLGAEAQEQRAV